MNLATDNGIYENGEGYDIPSSPRRVCRVVEPTANIQLATCSPNFLIQESIETFGGFYADVLVEPIQWQDGYIIPPSTPGIGVELNEEVADTNPYTQYEVFPPMVPSPVAPEIE